jgi:hypothetical protein
VWRSLALVALWLHRHPIDASTNGTGGIIIPARGRDTLYALPLCGGLARCLAGALPFLSRPGWPRAAGVRARAEARSLRLLLLLHILHAAPALLCPGAAARSVTVTPCDCDA